MLGSKVADQINSENWPYDSESCAEGWILSHTSNDTIELQRVDEPECGDTPFEDDASAWVHVVNQARLGSLMHLRALEIVDPYERLKIKQRCGSW